MRRLEISFTLPQALLPDPGQGGDKGQHPETEEREPMVPENQVPRGYTGDQKNLHKGSPQDKGVVHQERVVEPYGSIVTLVVHSYYGMGIDSSTRPHHSSVGGPAGKAAWWSRQTKPPRVQTAHC